MKPALNIEAFNEKWKSRIGWSQKIISIVSLVKIVIFLIEISDFLN